MSHLHDGMVSQFSKILHHVLKSALQNVRLTKMIQHSHHKHKTFVLLCTTQSFEPVCAIACWLRWCHPHTIIKSGCFVFIFLCYCNPFESHSPTRELVLQQGWGFWLNVHLLTANIAKNHLLAYTIALELKFKKNTAMTILYFKPAGVTFRQLNYLVLLFTSLPIGFIQSLLDF